MIENIKKNIDLSISKINIDGEYFGLYGGAGLTGSGLYRFTDPTDPEHTAARMFPTQPFDSNVWKGVAYDGSRFLFVRSFAAGGTPSIYEYAYDFDDFTLVSGGESYTDWGGLGRRIHFRSSALIRIGEDLGRALLSTAALDAETEQLFLPHDVMGAICLVR
ncbi:hypothetical protein P4B35_10875 [Pontiellaceae bacterium B12227]|nr:hypothetical protein [Pontiellaceae bacterium B12227]